MRGNELVRRIQSLARERGVEVRWVARRGKGSHGLLYYGSNTRLSQDAQPTWFEQGRLEAIVGRIADGREIPKASRPVRGEQLIPLAAPMAAKAALYLAMREAQTNNVALARKLGCDEKEVRRMLDPRHPTKLHRIEEALAALGRRLVMSVEEAA